MRSIIKWMAATGIVFTATACGAGGPSEQDPSGDAAEETVGSAALELTSLAYSTYVGGAGDDNPSAIAVDSAGNAYMTGSVTVGGSSDVFVTKLSPSGARIYSVTFGGSGGENATGIAVDSAGNTYITGTTTSYGPSQDIFVTKLNAAGTALIYNVTFGGSAVEYGGGIAVDSAGNAYVTGATTSTNFPVTAAAFQKVNAGDTDAFVAKLNASATGLLYSTLLGGKNSDSGSAIAIDAYGYAYVTGTSQTISGFPSMFPISPGAFQATSGGGFDAFVAEIVPSGSALYYSTYLGGTASEGGYGIAVDSAYNAYVTGFTQSTNFPKTMGAYGGGGMDGFVTKLNASGTGVYFSRFLGGISSDSGSRIAVSSAGNAYVVGNTSSWDFPTTPGAFRTSPSGLGDAFVTQLSSNGATLTYSTYVGGSQDDFGNGIALDGAGNAYVVGYTQSTNFPTLFASQPTYGGGWADAFALKISGP